QAAPTRWPEAIDPHQKFPCGSQPPSFMRIPVSVHSRQHGDLPGLAFEGESALDADDGSASTARTHCRRDVADMPPLDAVASQSQDVSGEHVNPAQPAPGRRPYGPFAVKGDRIGELFCPHGLRQAHLARSDKASQTAATPGTSPPERE